jgi:heat shock protein HslJ
MIVISHQRNLPTSSLLLQTKQTMKIVTSSAIAIAIGIITASAESSNLRGVGKTVTVEPSSPVARIIGSEWKASEFAVFGNRQSSTIKMHHVLVDSPITINFLSATEIAGNAGCNNYFSLQATISDSRIDVSGISTTRMLCVRPGAMEQEHEYTSFLSNRSFYYQILSGNDEEDELVLNEIVIEDGNSTEGQVLARFVRPHSPPSDAHPRNDRHVKKGTWGYRDDDTVSIPAPEYQVF